MFYIHTYDYDSIGLDSFPSFEEICKRLNNSIYKRNSLRKIRIAKRIEPCDFSNSGFVEIYPIFENDKIKQNAKRCFETFFREYRVNTFGEDCIFNNRLVLWED